MRISTAVLTAVIATIQSVSAQDECIQGGFTIEFEGPCNVENVLDAYERQVYYMQDGSCAEGGAQTDLAVKLEAAGTSIVEVCNAGMDAPITPFYEAANRGTDMLFEKHFFNGRTDWQEEVETLYESDDETRTSRLRDDARQIGIFYDGVGRYGRLAWPGELTNFDPATCTANTAMCCWPKDRQANDNNGNCAKPYDINCVDKDPADNTNLCHVDYHVGTQSNEFESSMASSYFPKDNNDGEGSIHCHGFAWADDEYDAISRYKANNLYYVSMYDHMYKRGYVEEIPGAPMCGCIEQMPTVSRSDCTQIDVVEEIYKFTYDGSNFKASVEKVEIEYNACQGENNRNNDLYAYAARLYRQGRMSADKFKTMGNIITDTGCDIPTAYHLHNKHGLEVGYNHDEDEWTYAIGRDSLELRAPLGKASFRKSFFEDASHQILLRVCATCVDTHQKIYYKRLTEPSDNFDLLGNLAHGNNNGSGENEWGTDFTMHSTFEDAVNDANPWECPGETYAYGSGFPGECSPSGARVRNQGSNFRFSSGRRDVAFYISKPEDTGIIPVGSNINLRGGTPAYTSVDIGNPNRKGGTLESEGTYYVSGEGSDIWHHQDKFHYFSEANSGDITVEVNIASMSGNSYEWVKSGIMIRENNDPDSAYVYLFLANNGKVHLQMRTSKGAHSRHPKSVDVSNGARIRLVKTGEHIAGYISNDGGESYNLISGVSAFFTEDSFRVGLAVTGHERVVEAVFEDYDVYSTNSVATKVGANLGENNGVTTIVGSGAGTWGTTDSFYFVDEEMPVGTDLTASLFALTLDASWPHPRWAKGGIMIRDSLDEDASFVFLSLTNEEGVAFQSRERSGAGDVVIHNGNHHVPNNKNVELRLVKEGNTYKGYYKGSDDSDFELLAETTIELTSDTLYVGTAVTASSVLHNPRADFKYKDYQVTTP